MKICLGMVSRGRGRVVGLSLGVDRDSLVGHIGDITVVVVGGVLNVLGPAVGESNRVAAGDSAGGIGGLGGTELGLGVVISNTVFIGIGGGLLLSVDGGGVAVGGGGVGNHGGGVNDGSGVHGVGDGSVDSVSNDGSVHSVGNDGGGVGGGGMVHNRGGVVGGGVVGGDYGVGNSGSVVGSRGVIGGGSIAGNGGGSVDSGHRLLMVSITMDRLGSSVGLAGNTGVSSSVGLVHRYGDGGSVTDLHDLVVGLVSSGHSQKGEADKGLNKNRKFS